MPFDASVPRPGTPPLSAPIRDNFNALNDRDNALAAQIAAIPAGPAGPAGSDGQPGTEGRGIAEVYDSGDGRAMVRMSDGATYGPFTIAGGPAGPQGERGSDGNTGAEGPAGPEGRHVVNVRDSGDGRAIVDMSDGSSFGPFTVAGGPAGPQGDRGSDGSSGPEGPAGPEGRGIAEVYDSGDGRAIVRMSDGTTYGPFTIASGPAGSEGPQGPPGEVSNQQLNDAINGALATAAANSSANTNAVQPLDGNADQAAIIAKINELIQALRR